MDSSIVKPSKTSITAATTTTITTTTATNASTQNEHSSSRNWSNIPSDILQNLLKYLDLKIDVTRVRGVCVNWRLALPLSIIPDIPTKFKIPPINDDDNNNNPLYLLETFFFFLSPLNPTLGGQWIARLTQLGPGSGPGPKIWHVCNPLNAHDYFFSAVSLTGEINLLNCRAQQLCTSWIILSRSKTGSGKTSNDVAKKVVGGWNFKSDYLFAVLAQLSHERGLVMWRVGNKEWTTFEESYDHTWRILDIAYLNGRFYAFDLASWRMGVVNVDDYGADESPEMKFFSVPDIKGDCIRDCYSLVVDGCKFLLVTVHLVPSNGRLFMVVVANPEVDEPDDDEEDCKDARDRFDKIDAAEKKLVMFYFVLKEGEEMEDNTWERVTDIGDNIFFIGYDTSFSLPSASTNLPRWNPGSICLFTWPFPMIFDYGQPKGFENVTFAEYWRYFKMYQHNTEEEKEKGLVRFEKLGKHKYTGLFFPPPAWVIWRCPSRGNAVVVLHNLKFSERWKPGIESQY